MDTVLSFSNNLIWVRVTLFFIKDLKDFFNEYGDRMPSQLFEEHKKVVNSLKEYNSD